MAAALSDPYYRPIGPYTVADWLDLPATADGSQVELAYGYLHMTRAPAGEHQALSFRLARMIEDGVNAAGRTDLYVVPAVNVQVSTAWRTALIPDIAVLTTPPIGVSFAADSVAMVVEIWSPGNDRAERETTMAGYASAGVPFVWTVPQNRPGEHLLTAYRLVDAQYEVTETASAGQRVTLTAAPVPIELDLAQLNQ